MKKSISLWPIEIQQNLEIISESKSYLSTLAVPGGGHDTHCSPVKDYRFGLFAMAVAKKEH